MPEFAYPQTVRIAAPLLALLLLTACGSHPTGPTPVPTPTTVHATLTDTVSGATIGAFEQTVSSLPARITVSAAGHLDHSLLITSAAPTVDLIPDAAPFDLTFYRQFARGSLEGPVDVLRVLSKAPSIYLQRTGLTDANVAALEQAARDVIPALTGDRFQLAAWETGADLLADATGWVIVEMVNDEAGHCGLANRGGGHIWLNTIARCQFRGFTVHPSTFAHEIGHALGFAHVSDPAALMNTNVQVGTLLPTPTERYHAAIAYHRSAGNTDIDQD